MWQLPVTLLAAAAGYQVAATFSVLRGAHDVLRPTALFRHDGQGMALTFDDGPDPERTPRLLDLLDTVGAKATFFVVGEAARRHPALVRDLDARGHTVGAHGDRHVRLPLCSPTRLREEIWRSHAVLADLLGRPPTLMRPPFGARSVRVYDAAAAAGFRLVMWSVDSLDWAGRPADAVTRRLAAAGPGDIVLLHDGAPAATGTLRALEQFLATNELPLEALAP